MFYKTAKKVCHFFIGIRIADIQLQSKTPVVLLCDRDDCNFLILLCKLPWVAVTETMVFETSDFQYKDYLHRTFM